MPDLRQARPVVRRAFRPLCSRRCKLIDLGKWLNEEHALSEPLRPDHFAGYENLPVELDPDGPNDSSSPGAAG